MGLRAELDGHMPEESQEPEDEESSAKQSNDQEAEERSAPGGQVGTGAIQKEGKKELERSNSALAWSGLAAGLSMGFSMVTQALLTQHLPEAHWRPLIAKLGYSVGFLIVVLGRQQLYTENTLTRHPAAPAEAEHAVPAQRAAPVGGGAGRESGGRVCLRMGVCALECVRAGDAQRIPKLGREAMSPEFSTVLLRGIFAGWLIALMVWLLPFAEVGRIWVIILITYVVSLGDFSHVIAGSVDTLYLVAMGEESSSTTPAISSRQR